jgi:hypothetical protein
MKRGRPKKDSSTTSHSPETTDSIKEELERLRAELAYKNKLIEFLEERETVKKRKIQNHQGTE